MPPAIRFIVILLLAFAPHICAAQSYLHKPVSVKAQQKPLKEVLNIIGKQGGFYFSYNSNLVPADSLVDVDIWHKTVQQSLDIIFKRRFVYKETPKHIIIQEPDKGQYWYVSGYIVDELTGETVRDASVFETSQLVASLTNNQGYFKLRLKDKLPSTTINISKSFYQDTVINIMPGVDQNVKVSIRPKTMAMDTLTVTNNNRKVEGTWFGKAFLSSKQKIQSINLNKFFVDMPFQGSILPGLSSQGRMASQTVNSLSLNMIGGYTAGVKGLEAGTVFNIVKNDAEYVQMSGILNIVGGNMRGIQASCIHNNVLGTIVGVQMAGISNLTRRAVIGLQASCIYNMAGGKVWGAQLSGMINNSIDSVRGLQAAGIVNMSVKEVKGWQLSGIINTAVKDVTGVQTAGILNVGIKNINGLQLSGLGNLCIGTTKGTQVAGLFNYATEVKGVQFGLINIAHKNNGVPIGLFSFAVKGYHKASIHSNELMPYNISIKSGTRWLYNIYHAGAAPAKNNKEYALGFGFGSDLPLSKRFSVTPELTGNAIYLGNWAEINTLAKFAAHLNFRLNKYLSIYAGPSYNVYWDNNQPKVAGYATEVLPKSYKRNIYNTNLSSWIGCTGGITVF